MTLSSTSATGVLWYRPHPEPLPGSSLSTRSPYPVFSSGGILIKFTQTGTGCFFSLPTPFCVLHSYLGSKNISQFS